MDKRRWVRERQVGSLANKQFKKVVTTRKQVSRSAILTHPMAVTCDLRNGSLASLDRYLRKNGGIPDRLVSVELRKLIFGSHYRSKYRLVVIEHPSGPARKAGRKKKPLASQPSQRRSKIAADYRSQLALGDKPYVAAEIVARRWGCDPITVTRADKALARYEDLKRRQTAEAERQAKGCAAALARRDLALARARVSESPAKNRTD